MDTQAVAFSCDGKLLAIGAEDDAFNVLTVHDAATGDLRRRFPRGRGRWTLCLDFSPTDSTVLVAGGSRDLIAYNTATGNSRELWRAEDNWVVKSVVASIENRKSKVPLFEINNVYETFDNEYVMPIKSIANYYIKDQKLSNWLNKDSDDYLNKITQNNNSESDAIIKGTIEVMYRNYVINKKR